MLEGSVLISSQNENLITLIILVIFMENEGENIPLSEEDVGKVKMILNEKLFEDFEIHRHYFLSKFGDFVSDIPRHGIGLIELKEISGTIYSEGLGVKKYRTAARSYDIGPRPRRLEGFP